jgi:predicted nuclease with TOPRIM domain
MAKEKVVDLKPQNITEEELKNLQDLVNALNRVQIEIGSIESRKHGLLHQVISLQQQMQTLQKGFEELYGKVDINITDGAISYPEDEQADKKD